MADNRSRILTVLLASSALAAGSAALSQTNMMSAKGDWRGTVLDGSQAVIATNKYGEPTFIRIEEEITAPFVPAPLEGEALADDVKALCIDTQYDVAKLDAAAASWTRIDHTISAVKEKWGAYDAVVWVSPAARVQIWNGSSDALKNTRVLSRWRGGMTDTVFNPKRIMNQACNYTVMTTGFSSPDAFLARMTQHLGQEPKKVVTKEKWADGHWMIDNEDGSKTRIGWSMTSLAKPEQLLHVSVARVEK